MTLTTKLALGAAATLLIGVTTATADYHTHPELKPSSRCGAALQKNPLPDPGNIESLENYTTDCQPLYWDLPATVQLHVPVRAEYDRVMQRDVAAFNTMLQQRKVPNVISE